MFSRSSWQWLMPLKLIWTHSEIWSGSSFSICAGRVLESLQPCHVAHVAHLLRWEMPLTEKFCMNMMYEIRNFWKQSSNPKAKDPKKLWYPCWKYLNILKKELAEPFVHLVHDMPKRRELAVGTLGNVGWKRAEDVFFLGQISQTTLTAESPTCPGAWKRSIMKLNSPAGRLCLMNVDVVHAWKGGGKRHHGRGFACQAGDKLVLGGNDISAKRKHVSKNEQIQPESTETWTSSSRWVRSAKYFANASSGTELAGSQPWKPHIWISK